MTKEDNEYYTKNKIKIQARRKELLDLNPKKRIEQNKTKLEKYHKKIGFRKCVICKKEFQSSKEFRKCCSPECKQKRIKQLAKQHYDKCQEKILQEQTTYYQKYGGRENYLNRRAVLKAKIISILGDKCIVCGSKDNIEYHNIKSIKHLSNLTYILAHIKDFVCLCGRCHRAKTRLNQLTESQRTALVNL